MNIIVSSVSEEIKLFLEGLKNYKLKKLYENEINLFYNFLIENNLESNFLILKQEDIRNYFIHLYDINKLGAKSTLDTHIAALKKFFEYLILRKYNFDNLLGYISTQDFKNKISEYLKSVKSKEILPLAVLKNVLSKLDEYIENNEYDQFEKESMKTRYLKILFVRLYIKLNLIVPLKVSEMEKIQFNHFEDSFRTVCVNDYKLNITNSLRINLLQTLRILKDEKGLDYQSEESLFSFVAKPLERNFSTANLSEWFFTAFNFLELNQILEPNSKSFKVEKFKKTAIWYLISNNTNLLYLSELTGLSLDSLVADFSFISDNEKVTHAINSGLVKAEYYNYI